MNIISVTVILLVMCLASGYSDDFEISPRLVGGQIANINDYPWHVSIASPRPYIKCSGTIISPLWVLTAAHCGVTNHSAEVRAITNHSMFGGIVAAIERVITHPSYSIDVNLNMANDIALIRLKTPLWGSNILPAILPSKGELIQDKSMIRIAGWGTTSPSEQRMEKQLHDIVMPTVNFRECQRIYSSSAHFFHKVTEEMFCAGHLGIGKKAPCYGDSGSGAIYKSKVIGIVSFAEYCAHPQYPAVFTRVEKYVDWILSQM